MVSHSHHAAKTGKSTVQTSKETTVERLRHPRPSKVSDAQQDSTNVRPCTKAAVHAMATTLDQSAPTRGSM